MCSIGTTSFPKWCSVPRFERVEMSPRMFLGGSLKDNYWTIHVTDEHKSKKFEGYRLPESTIRQLIDNGVEYIALIDPNRGRYVSEIDDWYEYGVWDEFTGVVSLRQSWMARG